MDHASDIDSMVHAVFSLLSESTKGKTTRFHEITSPLVEKFATTLAQLYLDTFRKKYADDVAVLGELSWKTIEATFFEGIYVCTLVFHHHKQLQKEPVSVPTGESFDAYFNEAIQKFDAKLEYVSIITPPHLFLVLQKCTLLFAAALLKNEQFQKTSPEFKESVIIQYLHFSSEVLAAYLIQDSFKENSNQFPAASDKSLP